jgi:urea transport system ATP-binding protein
MLSMQNLNQSYGESHTLWDINIEIPEGSCICLMGRNGVGKTTLLRTIMGLESVSSGSMSYGSHDLLSLPAEARAGLGIGFVPQGREIFPQLTVEENLRIGLTAMKSAPKEIPQRIFELFPVLKQMLARRGGDLSGGQQQQLAIGRALVLNPKILILDEPTEGIQPNIVQQIGDIIIKLNEEEKMTVLLVEQKLPFAKRVGKHFVILDRGRKVASGGMAELSGELVQRYLTV